MGPRTRIWAFAHVMPGARVGADCNVGDHAFVENGAVVGDRVTIKNGVAIWDRVTIEDEVFLGPNMVFTNVSAPRVAFKEVQSFIPTLVKRAASIGANATVVCGVTIGEYALVGAGAVITRDIPAHGLVVGNPGRRVGWACVCGERLGDDLKCGCGRCFELHSEEGGLRPIS